MSDVNTTSQVACQHDGDTVTVRLPGTTLILTLDEVDTLHVELKDRLVRDVMRLQGEAEIDDIVMIADVSVPRPEAWRLSASLETIYFRDVIEAEQDNWPNERSKFDPHGFDWRKEGF